MTNARISPRVSAALLIAVSGAALSMPGCKVGPDYVPPEVQTPDKWSTPAGGGAVEGPAELKRWWEALGDPALESLLQRAISQSHDLRLAAARIAETRASRGIVNASFFPTVDALGLYERSRTSANSGGPPGGAGVTANNFQAGFDAGWEIDVFGRVARGVESADADIGAAVESQRDVLVSLMSEVARNYVDYRALQRRIAYARKNAGTQRDSLQLIQVRFNSGLVSELDVVRAQALLSTTESAIPLLEQAQAAAANRLAVLVGQAPGSVAEELAGDGKLATKVPEQLPVGLPSDLLRRRADIRSAERQVASANAQIGVATADLFPRFSLTGSFGISSVHSETFFEGSSRFWSFGPAVKWNILDFGRVNANIGVQEARTRQALEFYQQRILLAFEDVENALVSYQREQERRVALQTAVTANERAVTLATDLNNGGLTDYLTVLDAQRALVLTQDQLAQSEGQVLTNLIAVYKALGGGWEDLPVPSAPQRKIDELPSWLPHTEQAEVAPPPLATSAPPE